MPTVNDYYKYAQLATASYVDLSTILDISSAGALVNIADLGDPDGPPRMPRALADQFFDPSTGWRILGDPRNLLPTGGLSHDDPASGFAATLFQNASTGEKVLAIRGTDPKSKQRGSGLE